MKRSFFFFQNTRNVVSGPKEFLGLLRETDPRTPRQWFSRLRKLNSQGGQYCHLVYCLIVYFFHLLETEPSNLRRSRCQSQRQRRKDCSSFCCRVCSTTLSINHCPLKAVYSAKSTFLKLKLLGEMSLSSKQGKILQ